VQGCTGAHCVLEMTALVTLEPRSSSMARVRAAAACFCHMLGLCATRIVSPLSQGINDVRAS
jgi:hypothetical protein